MITIRDGTNDIASDYERRNELVLSQLSQVYYVARQIHGRLPQHVLLEDLVNAGVLGLIGAVSKFDPGKHPSLTFYASFRIRGAILDSLRALDWGSPRLRKKGRNVADSISRLTNQLGHPPCEGDIANDLGFTVSELQTLRQLLDGLQVANQVAGSRFDDREAMVDLVESAHADESRGPFETCLRSERSDHLSQAVKMLPPKEQTIISLYYRDELTMREVGEKMGLTESRVSQILSMATRKLRAAIEGMQLQEDSFW
jgi:RNA polymerase sigma factor for flagellar operon FliA